VSLNKSAQLPGPLDYNAFFYKSIYENISRTLNKTFGNAKRYSESRDIKSSPSPLSYNIPSTLTKICMSFSKVILIQENRYKNSKKGPGPSEYFMPRISFYKNKKSPNVAFSTATREYNYKKCKALLLLFNKEKKCAL